MDNEAQERWNHIVDPADSSLRVLMAVVRLLLDKKILSEEELCSLADASCQELVTEVEARTAWHTPWLTTEALAAKVKIAPDSVVLDAGCGFGGPARELAEKFGCRVIGVDREPLRLLHAIRQTEKMRLGDRVSFCWGVFGNLPFPDTTFDIVWAQGSLTRYDTEWREGVPTGMDPSTFQEFHRVLKAGAQLVCDVWLKGPVSDADVREFLRLTGFALENLEDCTETWLKCCRWSIEELNPDDVERRAYEQQAYEEFLQRGDCAYQFVAAKRDKPEPRPPDDT
jgi:SAM-dependent methyltransferase